MRPNDKNATPETIALYKNLIALQGKGTLFGHQHALMQGIGWDILHDPRTGKTKNKPDIYALTKKYPAVIGFDFVYLTEDISSDPDKIFSDNTPSDDEKTNKKRDVYKTHLDLVKKTHKCGGVVTFCWHSFDPTTNKPSNAGGPFNTEDTKLLKKILDKTTQCSKNFYKKLDIIASFANDTEKEKIPIIFRPFHEHNGNWFWWGKHISTDEEFIKLWEITFKYLTETKKVHNFLYAYSPDKLEPLSEKGYLYRYPGDTFVDIYGLDYYSKKSDSDLIKTLEVVCKLGKERHKPCALTECGDKNFPSNKKVKNYWTELFFNPIWNNKKSKKVSYMVLWKNVAISGDSKKRTPEFFVAYPKQKSVPQHESADNFIELSKRKECIFLDGKHDAFHGLGKKKSKP